MLEAFVKTVQLHGNSAGVNEENCSTSDIYIYKSVWKKITFVCKKKKKRRREKNNEKVVLAWAES